MPVVDPDDRELVMSCGAALLHLRIAASHFGYEPVVSVLPEPDVPDLLARLSLGDPIEPSADDHALFYAIPHRRTNRRRFEHRDLPRSLLVALKEQASAEGARLQVVETAKQRDILADLVAAGDRIQGSDRRFRRELAAWLHPNRERTRDGIPGYALGIGDLLSHTLPFIIRTFDWGRGQAARDRQVVEGSPVLAILATHRDTPRDWIQAGQALARVLLRATADGVAASFLNQPIEVGELRPSVRELLSHPGYPQLLLRMGYGPEAPSTPRRPTEEVLLR